MDNEKEEAFCCVVRQEIGKLGGGRPKGRLRLKVKYTWIEELKNSPLIWNRPDFFSCAFLQFLHVFIVLKV
jgi:hypothetical protein